MNTFQSALSFIAFFSVSLFATGDEELCQMAINWCEEAVQQRDSDFYQNNSERVRVHCKYLFRKDGDVCLGSDEYELQFNLCIESMISEVGSVKSAYKDMANYENECNERTATDLKEANKNLKYVPTPDLQKEAT